MVKFSAKIWILCLLAFNAATAQVAPWSERMAATMLVIHKDSVAYHNEKRDAHWEYETGLMLKSLEQVWYRTGDAKYFRFIQKIMDQYIQDNGDIQTYKMDEYNIDFITPGRLLLTLYHETGKEKYRLAADILKKQLDQQPRTNEGGFWHKKRYPNQMWLDGLYMAEPFYAEYSVMFDQSKNFDDIINQFVWMEKNARDEKTGLLYHGWDESRQQKWSDPQTGKSPNFWSRAMGWYAMALVDVLDYIPTTHPRRSELTTILQRLIPAVVKYQDPTDGCWYQVTDRITGKGNYREASGSCMFVYAIVKGVRKGYLNPSFMINAQKAYKGILKNFISTDSQGLIHLEKTVSVSGLGGNPYRDGSYEYYLSEKIRQDDLKGVGPFIMASVEMETYPTLAIGKGKTVAIDNFFNREFRKGYTGQQETFHYTWNDHKDSGYSLWGQIFNDYGAKTTTIEEAPTAQNLKNASVYIIVDPDTPKETASPNYIQSKDVKVITEWVKAGGVLVLLANDTSNAEIKHFNTLAKAFGISFTDKNRNMVKNNILEQGKFELNNHPIFKDVKKIYVKELVTLTVKEPAKAVLEEGGDVIMATAKVGKGTVFVLGDPWIYNEYLNGKRLPIDFENFKAAKRLSEWLLNVASIKK
jgi:unsaturated rhamnogalacturonyl hydrolase